MENTEKRSILNLLFIILIVVVIIGGVSYFAQKAVNSKKDLSLSATKIMDYTVTGALVKTNFGNFEIVFLKDKAPVAVNNFIKLSEADFYKGVRFHRVIKDFMIQMGDPLSKDLSMKSRWGTGGPGYKFDDEISDEKIVRGVVAMANSGPDTNGSQFFVVTAKETPWLDGSYTVFGKVVGGMEVVDKIGNSPTATGDVPVNDVIVEDIVLK